MSESVASAVSALTGRIGALLTAPADPALAPSVQVMPIRLRRAGIGHFVGTDSILDKEIFAQHLEAQVIIRVLAPSAAALSAAAQQAAIDLVGADQATLRGNGVLRVEKAVDTETVLTGEDGITAPAGRDIHFQVLFEHRPIPPTSEGVIATVPQTVLVAPISTAAHRVYASNFATDPLPNFSKVDGPAAGPAGRWVYNATQREIRQTSVRGAGGPGPDGEQQGTYLLLREAAAGGPIGDFSLAADVWSGGNGGLGLVFRFVDSANFGFFIMQQPEKFRLFGRRLAGVGQAFTEGGLDDTKGFSGNRWMRLELVASGDEFTLAIDERIALTGREPGLTAPGAVGLFCCRNATARFGQFRLTRL